MESSPKSRRARKPPPPKNSDLYSTVVIHEKDDATLREVETGTGTSDIYATMVYKDDVVEDEEESLPPLLKRLPKDFGGGGDDMEYFDDDESAAASVSGTMIVKTDRRRSNYSDRSSNVSSPYAKPRSAAASPWERRSPMRGIGNDEEENAGDFSTFVMREREDDEGKEEEEEEEMKMTVRKGGGSEGGGTMRRAVESMQKLGEVGGMGHGRRRKSSGGAGGVEGSGGSGVVHVRQLGSGKMSSSSIPECMTREDPSTKYELLHELGKDSSSEVLSASLFPLLVVV